MKVSRSLPTVKFSKEEVAMVINFRNWLYNMADDDFDDLGQVFPQLDEFWNTLEDFRLFVEDNSED